MTTGPVQQQFDYQESVHQESYHEESEIQRIRLQRIRLQRDRYPVLEGMEAVRRSPACTSAVPTREGCNT